jgi:ketosteroid isomerase-like protein
LHNTDSVLALYADDAVLLSEAGVFRGKSEIRKWLQMAFNQGSVLEAITAIREKSSNTIAYGTGRTKRLVGQEVHLGRYLIVLEKRRGKWIIVEHASFNVH